MSDTPRTSELAASKQRGWYPIGQAARLSGTSAKMIRHYEALGLIPKPRRTAADYRVYADADVHTLRFIRRARGLGFSTREIKVLLGLWRNQRRPSAEVKQLATKHIAALERKIAELQSIQTTLQTLIAHCHGDSRPQCPILDDLSEQGGPSE